MKPTVGDNVRFKKSGVAINGCVTKVVLELVDAQEDVWWRLTMRTKSEFVVKEAEIEIVPQSRSVRRAG